MQEDKAPVRRLTHRGVQINVYTHFGIKSIKYDFKKGEIPVYYKAIAYTEDNQIICSHSSPLIILSINQVKRKLNKLYYKDSSNPIFLNANEKDSIN